MTDEQYLDSNNDDVFVATADEFDDNLDAQLPGWPKVVGIISIVWGSISLLLGLCGVGGTLAGPMFIKMAQDNGQFQDGVPPQALSVNVAIMAMAVFGLILSVLLIVAGIKTVSRSFVGRSLHLAWAGLSILSMIVSIFVNLSQQTAIQQWIIDNPDTEFAQQPSLGGSTGMIVLFVISAFFMIWPVFCLVWFGLKAKTHHAMTGGADIDII